MPQAAVTELQGGYEVDAVGENNRVDIRTVKTGERVGTMWVIQDGLKPGDRVVVQGQQKLKAGSQVQPKPFREK